VVNKDSTAAYQRSISKAIAAATIQSSGCDSRRERRAAMRAATRPWLASSVSMSEANRDGDLTGRQGRLRALQSLGRGRWTAPRNAALAASSGTRSTGASKSPSSFSQALVRAPEGSRAWRPTAANQPRLPLATRASARRWTRLGLSRPAVAGASGTKRRQISGSCVCEACVCAAKSRRFPAMPDRFQVER
jgi:hypothetical protein